MFFVIASQYTKKVNSNISYLGSKAFTVFFLIICSKYIFVRWWESADLKQEHVQFSADKFFISTKETSHYKLKE